MTTIKSQGLTAGSLFKVLFVGLFFPLLVFGVGCGIASYFGHDTVSFNGNEIHGIKGLIGGCFIGIVLPLILSFFLWCLMLIGTWVWTRISKIDLTIKN